MLYEYVNVEPLNKFVVIGDGKCNLITDDHIEVHHYKTGFIIIPKKLHCIFPLSGTHSFFRFKTFDNEKIYTIYYKD